LDDKEWSFDQNLRNAELTEEVRRLNQEIESRYRESQLREEWRESERRKQSKEMMEDASQKGILHDSDISQDQRDAYEQVGKRVEGQEDDLW
jgi:hypothetical protein